MTAPVTSGVSRISRCLLARRPTGQARPDAPLLQRPEDLPGDEGVAGGRGVGIAPAGDAPHAVAGSVDAASQPIRLTEAYLYEDQILQSSQARHFPTREVTQEHQRNAAPRAQLDELLQRLLEAFPADEIAVGRRDR